MKRYRATKVASIQTRGQLVAQFDGRDRTQGMAKFSGIIEGAVLAYADLYGTREATELCFQLADGGMSGTLGREFGRSLHVPDDPLEVEPPKTETPEKPEQPSRWSVRAIWFIAGFVVAWGIWT